MPVMLNKTTWFPDPSLASSDGLLAIGGDLGSENMMVRCNLTIIMANKKYHDLPDFFAKHKVEVISSLPFYNKSRTDAQRGDGVFEDSIKALKLLNAVGYGKSGTTSFRRGSQSRVKKRYRVARCR